MLSLSAGPSLNLTVAPRRHRSIQPRAQQGVQRRSRGEAMRFLRDMADAQGKAQAGGREREARAGETQAENRSESGAAPASYATAFHAPVLVETIAERLVTDPAGTYVDATLGGGGHAAALLDALGSEGRLLGLDRDAEALEEVRRRFAREIEDGRLVVAQGNFARLEALVRQHLGRPADGVLLDLGVSSHQLDAPERGFSFQADGPLDMRMDPRGGLTAAQVVNDWSEGELRQLFYDYGEERRAPQVARAIAEARPLETTGALAEAVRAAAVPPSETKTLARVFQALRIAVNGELDALEAALRAGPEVLRSAGRMAVLSYHSLEDRRVKRFFRYGNFENQPVRDLYGNLIAPMERIVSGPLGADEDEVMANARARSARLRFAARRSDEAVREWHDKAADA